MQAHQRGMEISGKPGKVWGNVFVPSNGNITVRISGDTLQATVTSGLEQTDSWVRIQNIDSVEIAECPEYLLLALGIFLVLSALGMIGNSPVFGLMFLAGGIASIAYAFINKRRLLTIYSLRYTIPVFMTKPPTSYKQFAEHVMAIARHLNAPSAPPQVKRPTNGNQPALQANRQQTTVQ